MNKYAINFTLQVQSDKHRSYTELTTVRIKELTIEKLEKSKYKTNIFYYKNKNRLNFYFILLFMDIYSTLIHQFHVNRVEVLILIRFYAVMNDVTISITHRIPYHRF